MNRPCPTSAAPASAAPAVSRELMPATTIDSRRRLQSRDLLGNAQEVEIVHAGHVYRLRQTALGKLILTK